LQPRIDELERRKAKLDHIGGAPPVRLHPNLAETRASPSGGRVVIRGSG
jgi:hypothetical protein